MSVKRYYGLRLVEFVGAVKVDICQILGEVMSKFFWNNIDVETQLNSPNLKILIHIQKTTIIHGEFVQK